MIQIKCSIKHTEKPMILQGKMISAFGDDIKNGDITIDQANNEKS